MHFMARYGKTYSTKGDLARRFGIFVSNLEAIATHNKGNTFKKGVNQFSDMTLEEFSEHYGKAALPQREKKASKARLGSTLEEV